MAGSDGVLRGAAHMRCLSIIAVSVWLTACGGPSSGPEQRLRQWIENAEVAAEEKDRRGLLSMISENYADARGNDHSAIDGMLRFYFLRQQTVSLVTKIDEISVSGGTAADVVLTVGMAGTNNGESGFTADAYRFHFELENDGDDWVLIGAKWAELGRDLR